MQNQNKKGFLSNLKFDLPASIVVFLVALPLCIGISLASTSYHDIEGLEDFAGVVMPGLISGIIGGLVVGFFSDSRYGVSGPAAGLITIVTAAIIEFGGFENGGFEKFVLAVALGGAIQFLLGVLKAGFVAYYIPFSVIKGMLAGIGVTIFLKEVPHFFGYDKDPEGDLNNLGVDGHTTGEDIWLAFDNIHLGATIIAVVSLVILVIWGMKFIKNNKFLSMIPGPLLAIVVSIGVASLFMGTDWVVAGEHLVSVPEPKSVDEFKSMFYLPDFSAISDPGVWLVALVIALVASIESLLCVEATDKMDPNKGRTPMNKELRAQGIGNIASGLLGGLPVTQVIVRSSANIGAGAKSKWSAVMHGGFLMLFIVLIPGILNMIPRATLAAVLILIGWKLASPKTIKQIIKSGWEQWVPFFTVVIVMYFTNLLVGVGTGLAVAFLFILYRNYKMPYFIGAEGENEDIIVLTLSQHATFLNKATIMKRFDSIEDGKKVIINLTNTLDIDYDIKEAIKDFQESAADRNIRVEILE